MKRLTAIVLVSAALLQIGCAATGAVYDDMVQSVPPVPQDMGRIYFYRPSKFVGAAIQPKVRLNDEVVGKATPGGFFFVDRNPGKYTVSTSTEVEKSLTMTLDGGQTRYVRLTIGMGIMVGRVYPELRSKADATAELAGLKFADPKASQEQ